MWLLLDPVRSAATPLLPLNSAHWSRARWIPSPSGKKDRLNAVPLSLSLSFCAIAVLVFVASAIEDANAKPHSEKLSFTLTSIPPLSSVVDWHSMSHWRYSQGSGHILVGQEVVVAGSHKILGWGGIGKAVMFRHCSVSLATGHSFSLLPSRLLSTNHSILPPSRMFHFYIEMDITSTPSSTPPYNSPYKSPYNTTTNQLRTSFSLLSLSITHISFTPHITTYHQHPVFQSTRCLFDTKHNAWLVKIE